MNKTILFFIVTTICFLLSLSCGQDSKDSSGKFKFVSPSGPSGNSELINKPDNPPPPPKAELLHSPKPSWLHNQPMNELYKLGFVLTNSALIKISCVLRKDQNHNTLSSPFKSETTATGCWLKEGASTTNPILFVVKSTEAIKTLENCRSSLLAENAQHLGENPHDTNKILLAKQTIEITAIWKDSISYDIEVIENGGSLKTIEMSLLPLIKSNK